MKFKHSRFVSIYLACTILGGATGAADAASDLVTTCKTFRADFPDQFSDKFSNLGECISFFRTLPVETCQMLKEDDLLDDFGYSNEGECIVALSS